MADDDKSTKTAPGANLGKGIFGGGSPADSNTWKMTPKYADPFANDVDRRLARFMISDELAKEIQAVLATITDTSRISRDTVLQKLSDPNKGYFDFFLQSVDESFDEKFQIVETLGDSYAVFGLGKRPRIFNFVGALINSVENDWRVNFIYLIQQYLGISRLSKFQSPKVRNVVTLHYDSMFIQGAILNLKTTLRADNELYIPFGFSMLVTRLEWVDLGALKENQERVTQIVKGTSKYPEAKNATFALPFDTSELIALNKKDYNEKSTKIQDSVSDKEDKKKTASGQTTQRGGSAA